MADSHTVSSLAELMAFASQSGNEITMKPGTHRVAEYSTPELLAAVGQDMDRSQGGRPSVPVLVFSGSDNTFQLEGVVPEVDTSLYDHLPTFGYHRFFFISGNGNHFRGLTVRYVGPNQGTN